MIAVTQPGEDNHKLHPKKALLWLSIVSMIMIFGGLTSAIVVSQQPGWFGFAFPKTLWIATAVLLISSIPVQRAVMAAKRNHFKSVTQNLAVAFLLGIAFAVLQFLSWSTLVENEVYLVGKDSSGSYLYVITGLHLAHLAFGLAALAVSWVKSLRRKYFEGQTTGLELTAIFWHFLDGLWIYLFLFLLYIR